MYGVGLWGSLNGRRRGPIRDPTLMTHYCALPAPSSHFAKWLLAASKAQYVILVSVVSFQCYSSAMIVDPESL